MILPSLGHYISVVRGYPVHDMMSLTSFNELATLCASGQWAGLGKLLRGGDCLHQIALRIVNTVAMPSWITGEAAGWCAYFLSYVLPLGSRTQLTWSPWSQLLHTFLQRDITTEYSPPPGPSLPRLANQAGYPALLEDSHFWCSTPFETDLWPWLAIAWPSTYLYSSPSKYCIVSCNGFRPSARWIDCWAFRALPAKQKHPHCGPQSQKGIEVICTST